MALVNTLNFLPQVFRTPTNQRFTGAVVDQLVQDPVIGPLNGYIGRTFTKTYKLGDNYVPEPDANRRHYQLEPSVVLKDDNGNILFNANYVDLLKTIDNNNGFTDNHQRLFSAESYSFDGKFDYDKFVNYGNYYWLPGGPKSVPITTSDVPLEGTFVVTKNTSVGGYTFSGVGGHPNTQVTLARGGIYKFVVDQPGSKFWIQEKPGLNGRDPVINSINTRQIYGVTNNGADQGTITFRVPQKNAQDFFINLPQPTGNESVDVAVEFPYTKIQNRRLSSFLKEFPAGLDGINTQLLNKIFIFVGNHIDATEWTTPAFPAGYEAYDLSAIRPGDVIAETQRTGSWQVTLTAIDNGADYVIQLLPYGPVDKQQKIYVLSGKTYAGYYFWLNNNRLYAPVPRITSVLDYLFYQDSTDIRYLGEIKIVDANISKINVTTDIIGKVGYTSPNGVIFTNGLKVKFDSSVLPDTYAGKEYYVEGVGTSIKLVPVTQLIVPESFGEFLSTEADYITINRASQDANPWSRSNSWFHKDVLLASANYNRLNVVDYGPNIPGRRPIIEFDPNIQLYEYGVQHKDYVDLILGVLPTDPISDAFNEVEGQIAVWINGSQISAVDNGGVKLVPGQRIIFANDYDTNVRDKIYTVDFERINNTNFIRLLETYDDPILPGENVLVTQGTFKGKTYRYNGSIWKLCQVKHDFNQPPLFDLVDADGYSFADTTVYPDSTFTGNKIFGYPVVSGVSDTVLNFPLKYQNFNNIGDIVFQNFYDTDTFTYVNNLVNTKVNLKTGYLVINSGLSSKTKVNNWVKTIEDTQQYQIYTKFHNGYVITEADGTERAFVQIDQIPSNEQTIPYVKVYLNNDLLIKNVDYEVTNYGVYNIVKLLVMPAVGDKIDVAVFTLTPNKGAYYEAPKNLDLNPINVDFDTITLGQMRLHYNKLLENKSINATATVPIQDTYLKAQGGLLTQHSSPLIYAMTFLNDPAVNFIESISLARKEYTRFKNKFLSLCSTLKGIDYNDPVTGVDSIMQNINAVKNSNFPWYYSDMVPQGSSYNTIEYTVYNARQTNYELASLFDNTNLSNRAVLIYKNNTQLVLGKDYTFSSVSPAVTFTVDFAVGDKITIRDYFNTDGCYVPETPSKLGLYPKFKPEIYIDNSYRTPTQVIRGHDGSVTPAFGDFRDDYLLELERRIYNNIKADYRTNEINAYDVIPGKFRNTEYTRAEFNQLVSQNFLQWVGNNKVDYTTNKWFDVNDSWTWNYVGLKDYLTGEALQGSWRAIYQYWYDTDSPHAHPWEMLGFSEKPTWWEDRYGPAPYTGNNLILWEDLEAGYVWNNGNSYNDRRFVRPGLTKIIPVDSAGNLKSPTEIPLTGTISKDADTNFSVGDYGPVEVAWRRSSDYPYAVQVALAITKPAKYFATQLDTSRFYRNAVTGFFSSASNEKINPELLAANGDTVSVPGSILRTSGYINWVGDYIKNLGIDPVSKLKNYFDGSKLSVQLNYKVGGFTDKNFLTILAEQTSPGSTNASVILPDANYNIYLRKSEPVKYITFSAVIIEKTSSGYSVSGYDTANPFFNILPSIANSSNSQLTEGDLSVKIYKEDTGEFVSIPYGTTFATTQQTADFLISYGRYLTSEGFEFEDFNRDLGETQNWVLSVREFLYWAQQGWAPGTIIVLNPAATSLTIKTKQTVVDEISNLPNGSRLLNVNFLPIKHNNFTVVRKENFSLGNETKINTIDGSTICFGRFNLVQTENVIIFDNVTEFNDIIYVPALGSRQYRLKIQGAKTGAWTGALSAPGYVYSNPTIDKWLPNTDYKQGDIIEYNNEYYTAKADVVASEKFNKLQWTQIKNQDVQRGLLPSFGQNAAKFDSIYNIDRPPVDETLQAFSAGLIGFRQRNYFTDLGVSIPTQTKFYQGMIKQKGTKNAVTALTKATFDNVGGTIKTYEEWAFRVGEYGDLNRNKFNEFILDQKTFKSNPVAFTVTTDTYNTGNIIVNLKLDANLLVSNVYNSSNTQTISTSLYSNRRNSYYPTDLPTAGYVNLDDVSATVYDLSVANVYVYKNEKIVQINEFKVGDHIWVAKDLSKDWNVYRINTAKDISGNALVAGNLVYVQDNYGSLQFNSNHTLANNDFIALTSFNDKFDGLYKVVDAKSSNTAVTVTVVNNLDKLISSTPIKGTGTVYKLGSVRFPLLTTAQSNPPTNGYINGDRVWIDNDSNNKWAVYQYNNSTWTQVRGQLDKVNIDSIDRTFLYNRVDNNILSTLDYIDPVKGKVLNFVARDIDYQRNDDPATYNMVSWVEANAYAAGTVVEYKGDYYRARDKIFAGNYDPKSNPKENTQQWEFLTDNTHQYAVDYHWSKAEVGKIWWDISQIRYIDYEQDALIYRLNQWGKHFPGSMISVYQWIESTVLPSQYVASGAQGQPLYPDDSAYSTFGYVDQSGAIKVKYYYWVTGLDNVAESAGKFNSINSITSAIEDPLDQGVPYMTVLRNDTVALHNVNRLLTGTTSVLHLGSRDPNADLIHSQYALIQEGNPDSEIPQNILDKFVDSLAGTDSKNRLVPDPALPPAQAYGIAGTVKGSPRQSIFIDRSLALSNYLTLVNVKLKEYPVVQRKILTLLKDQESIPNASSGQYDIAVKDQNELGYIDTNIIGVGYKALVLNDYKNLGKWAIYSWTGTGWAVPADGTRLLGDGTYGNWIQSYKTDLYWSYADWYDSTYDYTVIPDITVANNIELGKINPQPGQYVKVSESGDGNFVVYRINSDYTKSLVGIQNGTIQITTGSIPNKELRNILTAMEKEIFIEDLAVEYNLIFFALIKYALSEQKNLDWVFKTSFLTATQYIRKLEQFPAYTADNQNYYLDFINETKPYRTILREFVVDYQRDDPYNGDITDFDIPPYYDANLKIYRSPNGEQPIDDAILSTDGYTQWKNNHTYKVVAVTVEDPGIGYTIEPQITIVGGGGTGATASATVDSLGRVSAIYVDNPGNNYLYDPEIRINGLGIGARAKAVLRNIYTGDNAGNNSGHNLVRNIKTNIKFDRTTYTNSNVFVFWSNILGNVSYIGKTIANNAVVVLNNQLFRVNQDYVITGNVTAKTIDFPANVTLINSSDFNNANDRIVAFNGNINLKNLSDGIDYPGVKLSSQYTDTVFDTLLSSRYSDPLGVDAANVAVDGGAYVDTFSSHAPQELIPGRAYDSFNLTVFDRNNLGFRFFDGMNQDKNYLRISANATTQLVQDLNLSDKTIYVQNALKLPSASRAYNSPGAIFINGEKITYYRNYAHEIVKVWAGNTIFVTDTLVSHNSTVYKTLGNVYARNIPWEPNTGYPLNANVYYSGNSYIVNGNVQAPLFADILANVTFLYTGELSGFNTVKANVEQIDVNSLSQIRRGVDGTGISKVENWSPYRTLVQYPIGSYLTFGNNVYVTTGNIYGGAFTESRVNANLTYYGPAQVHLSGSRVVDASLQQKIPSTTLTSTDVVTTTAYYPTTVVSYGISTTANITVSVGDILTSYTSVDQWHSNTSLPLGSYTYFGGSSYKTTGNVYGPITRPWTANTVIAGNTYISFNNITYVTAGNVYAKNIKWQPNVVFTANANVYYNGNSFTSIGNVFANTATWQANTVFSANTYVYYANLLYTVNPNANVYGSTFTNISSNLTVVPSLTNYANISANISYLYVGENSGFNTISSNARVISDVEAAKFGNVLAAGNVSYQFDGNNTPAVTLRSLDTVTEQKSFAALIIGGQILGEPDFFDGNINGDILFDTVAFDNNSSVIYVNGVATDAFLGTARILGTVDRTGRANVSPATDPFGKPIRVYYGSAWYDRGPGLATNGLGLDLSNTEQATFLKADPSFAATDGKTP